MYLYSLDCSGAINSGDLNFYFTAFFVRFCYFINRAWYEMEWNRTVEWNENFGLENGRSQTGMEDFKNGVEDNLPYFHTNSMLDFVQTFAEKYIRKVINNILTDVFSIILLLIFVEKSRYFSCVYWTVYLHLLHHSKYI